MEVPEDLVGASTEYKGIAIEFHAAPISENRLLSCGELRGGPQTFSLHEESDDAFQLMYTGRLLARRAAA
jgi:hypothetical protein